MKNGFRHIILDCQKLDYITIEGLRVVVRAQKAKTRTGPDHLLQITKYHESNASVGKKMPNPELDCECFDTNDQWMFLDALRPSKS